MTIESSVIYKIPKHIDYDRDLREKADFIYENAKEYLLATIETRKDLEKKALLMLSFIFAVVSFGIARSLGINLQVLSMGENSVIFCTLIFLTVLILCYVVIAIVIILKIFSPRSEYTAGNETKYLACQENIEQYFPLTQIGVAWTYQERIDLNITKNANYADTIKICLIWLITLPPIIFAGIALITLCLYFWFPQWHLVHY